MAKLYAITYAGQIQGIATSQKKAEEFKMGRKGLRIEALESNKMKLAVGIIQYVSEVGIEDGEVKTGSETSVAHLLGNTSYDGYSRNLEGKKAAYAVSLVSQIHATCIARVKRAERIKERGLPYEV